MSRDRRIALVCMTPATDGGELGGMQMPSYGIRRILASLAADETLKSAQIAMVDVGRTDVDAYVQALDEFEPDIVGMSVYVWSTPCLVEVARRLKRLHPHCVIVFGGPSARTALFDLAPYRLAHTYLDAVVERDGEASFREIAHLPALSRTALESVQGLALPGPDGWAYTAPRLMLSDLDSIASPFQLDLMEPDSVAYLETFRGCPLSCAFCEWGVKNGTRSVFSADYLTRELEAFAERRSPAVFLLDAGLNLNARGFENLKLAESRVGLLRNTSFWCEIYPSRVRDEHLEFLANTSASYLGIGLQSIDTAVLKVLDRPFKQDRFAPIVRQLAEVAQAEIQIIFGLPSDDPAGFLRTLEFARSLPVAVRAYHCLVLPDALLTRGKPEWQLEFDPITLEMVSCLGWSHEDIMAMRARLSSEALAAGGKAGSYWWFFPRSA